MKLDSPRLPVKYLDSGTEISELVSALDKVDTVALDAERASGFRYSHKAYLIQVAIAEVGIWLIDPVADGF